MEVGVGFEGFGVDEYKAFHGPSREIHFMATSFLQGFLIGFGADSSHQIVVGQPDTHFVVHHEAQSPHHLFLFPMGNVVHEVIPDSVGKGFAVGHEGKHSNGWSGLLDFFYLFETMRGGAESVGVLLFFLY